MKKVVITLVTLVSLSGVGAGTVAKVNDVKENRVKEEELVAKESKEKLVVALDKANEKEREEKRKIAREKARKEMERLEKEKAEKERLAKEKEEQEKLVEQKRLEQEKLVEQKRLEQQKVVEQQEVNNTSQVANNTVNTTQSTTTNNNNNNNVSSNNNSQNVARTDGFNYSGNHYSIASFSGSGNVPHWTNNVYKWADFPSHYLIERQSYAGQTVGGLTVGSKVTINGSVYTVYNVLYNQPNDDNTANRIFTEGATVSIQVCATDSANSTLNLYFLK